MRVVDVDKLAKRLREIEEIHIKITQVRQNVFIQISVTNAIRY